MCLIRCYHLKIGDGTNLSSFSYIRGEEIVIGKNTRVESFSIIKARQIHLGNHARIASFVTISAALEENCMFHLGNHSWVFPHCQFDPVEGLYIGDHVGTGGKTQIFTHGSWGDYLKGYNSARGKVIIEDYVWMGWNTFVLPNVKIGEGSIVSAKSLVSRNINPYTINAGNPAKEITKVRILSLNDEKFLKKTCKRFKKIMEDFSAYVNFKFGITCNHKNDFIWQFSNNRTIELCIPKQLPKQNDIIFSLRSEKIAQYNSLFHYPNKELEFRDEGDQFATIFNFFIRRFGLRFTILN